MDAMKGEFNSNQPIFLQIIEQIRLSIARGELKPGQKVAPVREMAVQFRVNPNTMQKSLAKLEEMGYLRSESTSGRYVTDNLVMIERLKLEVPFKITKKYIADMKELGLSSEDVLRQVGFFMKSGGMDGQRTGN